MGRFDIATFFPTVISLMVAQSVAAQDRNIVGYAAPWTVRPGETVSFHVSTIDENASYRADLVSIINGDSVSKYGDLFEVRSIDAPFNGDYTGAVQPLNLGSYVEIAPSSSLDTLDSFTVSAWIFPTFDPSSYEEPDLENPDPFNPPTLNIAEEVSTQTIVSRFDGATGEGWHLSLDPSLYLTLTVATDGKTASVVTSAPVRDWDWAYASASFDARTGEATVWLIELPYSPGDQFTGRELSGSGPLPTPRQTGPLRIAAIRDGIGAEMAAHEKPGQGYFGRIQDVRIANRALDVEHVKRMANEKAPPDLAGAVVMDLDFGLDITTNVANDVSGNTNHGVVVNIPERAVRGRFWETGTVHWSANPSMYDAIHFHGDDLYDAEWKSDFVYKVPQDLPSGVYAARIQRDGFTDYAPFFVAAAKGQPRAKLAYWLSTYDYLAYQNITIGATVPGNYPSHNFNIDDYEFLKKNPRFGTSGVYNQHVDGTYFIHGSQRRPDMHTRPDGLVIYNFSQDTHALSFFDHEGIAYDIITDELVDREGMELLAQYDAVISSSHPEYISGPIWDAMTEYTQRGGRLAYLGGNGWFWVGSENPAYPDTYETRNFSAIGERMLTGGQVGGLLIESGRTPGAVVGLEMAGMIWHGASDWKKMPDAENPRAAWIFDGTTEGDSFGDYGIDAVDGGAAGFETDKFNPNNGVPRHALHIATAGEMKKTIENVKIGTLPLAISYDPASPNWAGADVVFFETANGGAVFSAGSITWMSSTPENGYQNDVAQITRNVIDRFLDPTPFAQITGDEVDDVDRTPPRPAYEHADGQ